MACAIVCVVCVSRWREKNKLFYGNGWIFRSKFGVSFSFSCLCMCVYVCIRLSFCCYCCCFIFGLEMILEWSIYQKTVHFRLLTSKKIGLLLFKKKSHLRSGFQGKLKRTKRERFYAVDREAKSEAYKMYYPINGRNVQASWRAPTTTTTTTLEKFSKNRNWFLLVVVVSGFSC